MVNDLSMRWPDRPQGDGIGKEIVSDRAPQLARGIESVPVSTFMQLITEFYHESSSALVRQPEIQWSL
jgi:hypothetical protein